MVSTTKVGDSDIVGIYRLVGKIDQGQIVSYGKRLMLEFIVPEPAAFLRYTWTNKPVDHGKPGESGPSRLLPCGRDVI